MTYDIDGKPDEVLSLTLECEKGEFIIGTVDGLTFETGNGTQANFTDITTLGNFNPPPSAAIRLNGTAVGLNLAMRDLRYRGLPGRVGHDTILVAVTDDPGACPGDGPSALNDSAPSQENDTTGTAALCALGGSKTTRSSMGVFLSPVNRPPTVHVTSAEQGTRTTVDAPYSLRIGQLGHIWIEDPDVRETAFFSPSGLKIEGPITVDLVAESGRLGLDARGGLSFSIGTGISDSASRFTGAIDDVNRALETLSYRCSTANGCDTGEHDVTISVDDNGYTGKGGPMLATVTFNVQVHVADGGNR